MQLARLDHLRQLPAQPRHRLVDGAPVGLDLGLAGSAHEAEAAALAFEVGPGAHQPGALVAQRGQFHLQHALARAGAVGENLQDQAGPVEQLDPPFAFEVALLHRRHRAVDQNQLGLLGGDPRLDLGNLAGPEQQTGMGARQAHDLGGDHLQPRQRGGKRHGFLKRGVRRAAVAVRLDIGMQDDGTRRAGFAGGDRVVRAHSSPS